MYLINIKTNKIMKTALEKYLDKNFNKVKQTFSANWCGDKVWIVYSEDGITNSVDGFYIHKYDNENYVLVHRFESEEETIIKDIYYYTEYVDSIRKLVSIDTIKEYIGTKENLSIEKMYKVLKGI